MARSRACEDDIWASWLKLEPLENRLVSGSQTARDRKLEKTGAPRPMKMGTIASPWRSDAIADYARRDNLRQPTILRYASWRVRFPSTAGLSIDPWMDIMGKRRTFSISFPTEGFEIRSGFTSEAAVRGVNFSAAAQRQFIKQFTLKEIRDTVA
jgi:predicted DNA-binding transcriptional regulator AlpA